MAKMCDVSDDQIIQLIKDKVLVNVYLKSGIKLVGVLVGSDERSVFLEKDGTQMIYKNSISTIASSN